MSLPTLRLAAVLALLCFMTSCKPQSSTPTQPSTPQSSTPESRSSTRLPQASSVKAASSTGSSLAAAKAKHQTKIISAAEQAPAPDSPDGSVFDLITYQSPAGDLAAYLTRDPGDGQKHPAIIWITGGDCNSIGDVWSLQPRANDQSASGFRDAGMAMMFPSLRGGNHNPGQREGFYGEVDDVLAAREMLAALPYVDASQIYLGGHSTGGTLVMLVAESTDAFAAVFALGPVAGAVQYSGEFVYCDLTDETEIKLRSPLYWLDDVRKPTFVFAGAQQDNWSAAKLMQDKNTNPNIRFFRVPGYDHFSIIAPLSEFLANRIVNSNLNINDADLVKLK